MLVESRMDLSSIAAAMVGAQMSRVQFAVAAKLMRMTADQQASAVQLINAGQQNLNKLASAAAGVGTQLDITA